MATLRAQFTRYKWSEAYYMRSLQKGALSVTLFYNQEGSSEVTATNSCPSTLMQNGTQFQGITSHLSTPGALHRLQVKSPSPEAPLSTRSSQLWPRSGPPIHPLWDGHLAQYPGKLNLPPPWVAGRSQRELPGKGTPLATEGA